MFFNDDNNDFLSLSQLNSLVREVIELSLDGSYWVEAELASVRESRGHCYMELVEKSDGNNTPIAQARANCWANVWMRLLPKFRNVTGQDLCRGMKVLLRVKASFHEAYGFAWNVIDIDPTYTMGDMARKRQEILRILQEEGVIDLNKSLPVPMFAKRIAVVSSANAAGYGDFCNQLVDNEYGFAFTTRLFPAIMQGEQVEQSVINALNAINNEIEEFDVVVIIRGGGSTADLSGFDTLELAENVANFPLPVITGIGHDRDQSILDVIACVSVKTPTAVAAFLIDNLANTENLIDDAAQRINRAVRSRMEVEHLRIQRLEQYIKNVFSVKKLREENKLAEIASRIGNAIALRLTRESSRIDVINQRLPIVVAAKMEREQSRLRMLQQMVKASDPINILRRGYSIAMHDGVAITNPNQVNKGDEVTILMAEGVLQTKVE